MDPDRAEITSLLLELSGNNRGTVDALMPLVYDSLHGIARRQLSLERRDHTLAPTALVHEAYLKLIDQDRVRWQNRAHFYAIAARAMRRILVNHARDRLAQKRGGGLVTVTFDEELAPAVTGPEEMLALEDALIRLQERDPRRAQVVECRFFGGLTHEEIAEALGVSVPTVQRDWRFARAWLAKELAS
jgi:RNA polymerase sigma factor (TIGR02999 family)